VCVVFVQVHGHVGTQQVHARRQAEWRVAGSRDGGAAVAGVGVYIRNEQELTLLWLVMVFARIFTASLGLCFSLCIPMVCACF